MSSRVILTLVNKLGALAIPASTSVYVTNSRSTTLPTDISTGAEGVAGIFDPSTGQTEYGGLSVYESPDPTQNFVLAFRFNDSSPTQNVVSAGYIASNLTSYAGVYSDIISQGNLNDKVPYTYRDSGGKSVTLNLEVKVINPDRKLIQFEISALGFGKP